MKTSPSFLARIAESLAEREDGDLHEPERQQTETRTESLVEVEHCPHCGEYHDPTPCETRLWDIHQESVAQARAKT